MASLDHLVSTSRLRRGLPDPATRRYLRMQAQLSLAEVARLLRVTEAAVSRWETGRRTPSGSRLDEYAEFLERLRREVLP